MPVVGACCCKNSSVARLMLVEIGLSTMRDLILICLLAAFCTAWAWALQHEIFAAVFAVAVAVAGLHAVRRAQ